VIDVQKKIEYILWNEMGVEPEKITPEARIIEDLGADSLDTVELIMATEEEFGIEIHDAEAENISTVGDLVKLIEEKLG